MGKEETGLIIYKSTWHFPFFTYFNTGLSLKISNKVGYLNNLKDSIVSIFFDINKIEESRKN